MVVVETDGYMCTSASLKPEVEGVATLYLVQVISTSVHLYL